MKVIVQQIGKRLYLRRSGAWTPEIQKAGEFANAVEALTFCLRKHFRNVRFVSNFDEPGKERFIYPFGGDPVVKMELKKMRRAFRDNERLKIERRVIHAAIDMLIAPGKERRKQRPFKRKQAGDQQRGTA